MNQYTLYLALRMRSGAAEKPSQPNALLELQGGGKRKRNDIEEPETSGAFSRGKVPRQQQKTTKKQRRGLDINENENRPEIDQVLAQIHELKRKALLLGAKVPSSATH